MLLFIHLCKLSGHQTSEFSDDDDDEFSYLKSLVQDNNKRAQTAEPSNYYSNGTGTKSILKRGPNQRQSQNGTPLSHADSTMDDRTDKKDIYASPVPSHRRFVGRQTSFGEVSYRDAQRRVIKISKTTETMLLSKTTGLFLKNGKQLNKTKPVFSKKSQQKVLNLNSLFLDFLVSKAINILVNYILIWVNKHPFISWMNHNCLFFASIYCGPT